MKLIDVRKIEVKDRQRVEAPVENVEKLAASIKDVGLMSPVMLRQNENILVVGGTRCRAVKAMGDAGLGVEFQGEMLAPYMIPYLTAGDADDIKLMKMEFFENEFRFALSWQDRDNALRKLKAIVKEEKGREPSPREMMYEMAKARNKDGGEPTKAQVNGQNGAYRKAMLREQYKEDPRVMAAKSAKDADKIIEKDLKERRRQELAEKFKDEQCQHQIIIGDSVEVLKGLEDGQFDVVLSDPIYGIGAHEMHMFQTRKNNLEGGHHTYDDSVENWDRMFSQVPLELYRVCKPSAAVFLFMDISRFYDTTMDDETKLLGLKTRMERAGFTVWPRPLVWYKGNIGSLPKPETGPRYTAEYILLASKGEKKTTGVFHDVFTTPQTTGHEHGAGKPPELYLDILRTYAEAGDDVLDFCAGSFPILVAANELGCTATAIELDEKWEASAQIKKNLKLDQWNEMRKEK